MRTTLTLDPDVAAEIDRRRRRRGSTLKQEVNELLRRGLAGEERPRAAQPPSRTTTFSTGRNLIGDLDDIADALAAAEGESFH